MTDQTSDSNAAGSPDERVNPIVKYFKDFKILKETKREYWGLQIINTLDCLAYFAMFNIATVTLSRDFGFTDEWAGYIYMIFSGLTTIFLFFSGVITDWLGIKRALYIGIIGLILTRVGVVVTQYMDEPVRMNEETELAALYDGEGIPFVEGQPDLSITARDLTTFDVDLFGALTIGDVLDRISNADGNDGRIVAQIAPGWMSLRLEDQSDTRFPGPIVVTSTDANPDAAGLLGIEDEGDYSGPLDGGPVISNLNALNVADLNQGDGLQEGKDLFIRDAWGTALTLGDLGRFTTVKELRDHLREAADAAVVVISISNSCPSYGF